MTRRSRFRTLLIAGCVWLSHAQPLHAAPPARASAHAPSSDEPSETASSSDEERAAALRATGNQAMIEMRYVDALSAYQQAATLAPRYTGVLYSIARAHQLLGEFAAALRTLERFEQQASPETKAKVGRLDQLFNELRSRVGTLELSCNVTGARVLLRSKVIGTTPLPEARFEAGAALLEVEIEGYFPVRREVVIPAGGRLALELDLHARSNASLLTIRTSPGGATISVDGERQGTSSPSIELALSDGTHRITAQREGYEEASVPIVLRAGTTRDLSLKLERSVPITSRWWFWTGAGVLAAGAVALGVAELTERPADKGSLTPGQITAPLHF